MKKKILLLFLLLIAGFIRAAGDDQNLVTIDARGIGTSPDAAVKDALSQAIQQAAGAIVDSQTLLKNDEIIQEKILTASNAIVKKYDVLVPVKQNRAGLYEIRIRALVEQNVLKQKIIEHKIIAGEVTGAQDLWAEFVTNEQNQQDMTVMLEHVLSRIDFKKYMSFDVVGKNGKCGKAAELSIKMNGQKVEIAFGLLCMFDDKRFQQEVMPNLRRIFDALPFIKKHEFVVQGSKEYTFSLPDQQQPILKYRTMDFLPRNFEDQFSKHTRNNCVVREQERNNGSTYICGIMLNVSPRFRPNSQKFMCYHFPEVMPAASIETWEKLVRSLTSESLKNVSVSLCLLDADGEEIQRISDDLKEKPCDIQGVGFRTYHEDVLFISPNYYARPDGNYIASSPLIIRPIKGQMDLEDFKEVKSFRLEVKLTE